MRHLLVSGSAGFIGSNLVEHWLEVHPEDHLISLDALTYAGTRNNLDSVANHTNHTFVQGSINDTALLTRLFEAHPISGIIHLAAESHVDNSIAEPDVFIQTNVNGTFALLETAKRFWMDGPFNPKPGFENARFHHISTDEVYGSLGPRGFFTENTPYAPNSPYSASKASSDFLVRAYHHTYGLNTVTTNCSNNYGPKQHAEKLIPTIIRNAMANTPIPIYGDGENIRDWLYVMDHAKAIDVAFHHGVSGETYVVGANNEQTNTSIAHRICTLLDKIRPSAQGSYTALITRVQDRPGHDRRYAIDATKITQELGWKAQESFESGLRKTLAWYLT